MFINKLTQSQYVFIQFAQIYTRGQLILKKLKSI